jgi:hypothetical protein
VGSGNSVRVGPVDFSAIRAACRIGVFSLVTILMVNNEFDATKLSALRAKPRSADPTCHRGKSMAKCTHNEHRRNFSNRGTILNTVLLLMHANVFLLSGLGSVVRPVEVEIKLNNA